MPLLNDFLQYSIIILMGICLLTLIFINRKKNLRSKRQSDTQIEELRASLQRLENELHNAQIANKLLARTNQQLSHKLAENDSENKEKLNNWRQKKDIEEAVENEIRNHPSEYYYINNTMMNKPESRMFFYINESIKNLLGGKEQDYYILFPQVSLHAFIKQNASVSKNEAEQLKKILGGKNVDFILCHRYYDHYFYFYEPILMIEIDGPAHFYPIYEDSFAKTQENDQLKNNLANDLDLSLLRYRLLDGNISKADKTGINTALQKFFSDYNENQTEYIYYYDKSGCLSEHQYYNPPPINNKKETE